MEEGQSLAVKQADKDEEFLQRILLHEMKAGFYIYFFINIDSDGKEPACYAEDLGLIPGSGRSPGEGHGNPLRYSRLENSMDRSLSGYSPWGCKKSDTSE